MLDFLANNIVICHSPEVLQRSEPGNSLNGDEIPMEMDLTAAGPPLSDDESVTERPGAQAKTIMVYLNVFNYIYLSEA